MLLGEVKSVFSRGVKLRISISPGQASCSRVTDQSAVDSTVCFVCICAFIWLQFGRVFFFFALFCFFLGGVLFYFLGLGEDLLY